MHVGVAPTVWDASGKSDGDKYDKSIWRAAVVNLMEANPLVNYLKSLESVNITEKNL